MCNPGTHILGLHPTLSLKEGVRGLVRGQGVAQKLGAYLASVKLGHTHTHTLNLHSGGVRIWWY